MKFIHCKRDPHSSWGVNDPINLDHCLSYSAGTVSDQRMGREKPQAHAILFTMIGCPKPITWTFVDERHRDWDLGRLMELTYEPIDEDQLAQLFAEQGIETRVSELSKEGAPATDAEWKATPKYTTIYRDGVCIGVTCDSTAAWRELQESFEKLPVCSTMELPEGVQILSVSIDATRIGVMEKAALGYSYCVPDGGFPHRVSKEPA